MNKEPQVVVNLRLFAIWYENGLLTYFLMPPSARMLGGPAIPFPRRSISSPRSAHFSIPPIYSQIPPARHDRENLSINLLGGLQSTGLMVLHRKRQCFGSCCHKRSISRGMES
jgi:hypothetical protein